MNNALNNLGEAVKEAREKRQISQRGLAAMLNMSVRTIIELEKCRSNPKFETVALIADELDIDLDAVLNPSKSIPEEVPHSVHMFFAGMAENEAKKYVDLCEHLDAFKKD